MISSLYNIVYKRSRGRACVYCLTQLVKVCLDAVRSRNRTHQSGFNKCAPLIHKNPLPTHIILKPHKQ